MSFSAKLNGFWEEGYHYYIGIEDGRMTVRDYRRAVALETAISYDAGSLDRGERTVIKPEDNVLSRDGYGEPFTMIRELYYEDGELKLLYYYTIMGETLYTLHKVDHGPFDYIMIRDREFLPVLQGKWEKWSPGGRSGGQLRFDGDRLTAPGIDSVPVHVISYKSDPANVFVVPADLTSSDFGAWTFFSVLPDMITSRMIICDASVPLSVFVRKKDLGTVKVPPEACAPVVSTMRPMTCLSDRRPDESRPERT